MSFGAEEMEEWDKREHQLGDYIAFVKGRYILLRGKYRGASLDTIPRGYIREYVLKTWKKALNDEEIEVFTQFGTKPNVDGQEAT